MYEVEHLHTTLLCVLLIKYQYSFFVTISYHEYRDISTPLICNNIIICAALDWKSDVFLLQLQNSQYY